MLRSVKLYRTEFPEESLAKLCREFRSVVMYRRIRGWRGKRINLDRVAFHDGQQVVPVNFGGESGETAYLSSGGLLVCSYGGRPLHLRRIFPADAMLFESVPGSIHDVEHMGHLVREACVMTEPLSEELVTEMVDFNLPSPESADRLLTFLAVNRAYPATPRLAGILKAMGLAKDFLICDLNETAALARVGVPAAKDMFNKLGVELTSIIPRHPGDSEVTREMYRLIEAIPPTYMAERVIETKRLVAMAGHRVFKRLYECKRARTMEVSSPIFVIRKEVMDFRVEGYLGKRYRTRLTEALVSESWVREFPEYCPEARAPSSVPTAGTEGAELSSGKAR